MSQRNKSINAEENHILFMKTKDRRKERNKRSKEGKERKTEKERKERE